MQKTIKISPEFEKLRGISPFWDNEQSEVEILKTDYDNIVSLINDYKVNDKIENLCYILILLKQEKDHLNSKDDHKEHTQSRFNDRLEVSKYIQMLDKEPDLYIKSIKFDLEKKYVEPKDNPKRSNFKIENSNIINAIWQFLEKQYVYRSSSKENYKEMLKKQRDINKPTFRKRELAQSLFRYLSKQTFIGENKKYFTIGYLFNLSGLVLDLSESSFNETWGYKSYQDFLNKKVRNNYFKKG